MESKKGRKQLTIRLTPEQHRRLKIVAATNDMKMQALVETAIEEKLEALSK